MADSVPASVPEDIRFADALRNLCYADQDFAKRYEGWEVVGRGAFATVVKVSLMGQPVALKIFTHLSEGGRARFRSEFASAIRLASPYVVRTHSVFDHGSLAWIEMEAVDGPNLEEELDRRERENDPFLPVNAFEIAVAIATALTEAHREGLVHRDIKPANILLPRSRRPVAKLGDFGIARVVGAAKLTGAGSFPGTPKWGAPEAFAGKPVESEADVYSLCLCLFVLFTNNRLPWVIDADAPLETLMAAHVKRPPLRMSYFQRDLPEDLDALVLRGLAKKPSHRPTATEILEALKRESRQHDIVQSAAPPVSQRAWSRWRATSALALGLGVTLSALLVLRGMNAGTSSARVDVPVVAPARPQVRTGAATAEGHPATVGLHSEELKDRQQDGPSAHGVRVSLAGDFIRLQNGPLELRDVHMVVVGLDGARYAATLAGVLEPRGTVDVALDSLVPTPRPGGSFARALITAKSGGQPLELGATIAKPTLP